MLPLAVPGLRYSDFSGNNFPTLAGEELLGIKYQI